jgi:hypothetical protein
VPWLMGSNQGESAGCGLTTLMDQRKPEAQRLLPERERERERDLY